jgi:hypothetical protein
MDVKTGKYYTTIQEASILPQPSIKSAVSIRGVGFCKSHVYYAISTKSHSCYVRVTGAAAPVSLCKCDALGVILDDFGFAETCAVADIV